MSTEEAFYVEDSDECLLDIDETGEYASIAAMCQACGDVAAKGRCGLCGRGAFCNARCHTTAHARFCSKGSSPVFAQQTAFAGFADSLGDASIASVADTLLTDGVAVVEIYSQPEIDERNDAFFSALEDFPEYRRGPADADIMYVKGGFGALGNPSSFHHAFVRRVRQQIMHKMIPILSRVCQREAGVLNGPSRGADRGLEQIIDRLRIFRNGAKIAAESWHRDTTPAAYTEEEGDSIFGGWVNFDRNRDQYFSCIPTSHRLDPFTGKAILPVERTNKGFEKFSPGMQSMFSNANAHKSALVKVPPGHLIIFYQDIVHEVVRAALKKNEPSSLRLFTAFRLTHSESGFGPTNGPGVFSDMAVPLLKSGQEPAMWPKLGNWVGAAKGSENLEAWSKKTFRPELLVVKVKNARKENMQEYTVVPPTFHGVATLRQVAEKLELAWPISEEAFPLYTKAERALYSPSRNWTIDEKNYSF